MTRKYVVLGLAEVVLVALYAQFVGWALALALVTASVTGGSVRSAWQGPQGPRR